MEDRGFSELDLRFMFEHASGYRVDAVGDRFVIDSSLRGRWVIIVEPDDDARLLVIVTAYPIEE